MRRDAPHGDSEMSDLQRFIDAQESGDIFTRALGELRAGRKREHWMWFVFPQLAGLGRSEMARRYGLDGAQDARDYLAHAVLGPRLLECCDALLRLETPDAAAVLGEVDSLKLRSCMTLFAAAAPGEPTFTKVLEHFYLGVPDSLTTGLLADGDAHRSAGRARVDPMAKVARSVVVTGANAGIGRATALELARCGYDVIGTVRGEAKAEVLHDAAADAGVTLRTVLLDVADASSTERGFAEIAELTDGGPWAVVNNAGYAQSGTVEDVSDEDARAQLEVNLLAPMRIARLVLPAMRERGDGRIVNISSIGGRVGMPLMGWYCASKSGLEAVSNALRMEVEQFGIRVVLIEPGAFGTGIWEGGAERLPESQATGPYADAYRRANGTGRLSSLAPDPVWVARVVRLALANPVPLPRYLVGVDAYGLMLSEKLVPTALTDRVKSYGAGLRRLPFARNPFGGS